MLAMLTPSRNAHHTATGLDHVNQSKLISDFVTVIEQACNCNNSVMNQGLDALCTSMYFVLQSSKREGELGAGFAQGAGGYRRDQEAGGAWHAVPRLRAGHD